LVENRLHYFSISSCIVSGFVIFRVVPPPEGTHRDMFISTSLRSFLIHEVTQAPSERYTMKMDGHDEKKGVSGIKITEARLTGHQP
jgi:hypothetical protein